MQHEIMAHPRDSLKSQEGAFAGLTSGSGRPIAAPSAQAIARATAKLDQSITSNKNPLLTPSRPALAVKNVNVITSPALTVKPSFPEVNIESPYISKTLKRPFKAPCRAEFPPSTTFKSHPPSAIITPKGSPFTRLDLEMKSKNTPYTAPGRSSFKTPFKKGFQFSQGESMEKSKMSRIKSVAVLPKAVIKKEMVKPGPAKNSVFDLYSA